MEPSSSPASNRPVVPVDPESRIRHLPESAQAAFREFRAGGDAAMLDPLIVAILESYAPQKCAQPIGSLPGSALLMEEIGFDSLAITEVIFFTEDLFEITITNEELLTVRTLDDLRAFIRAKVSARAAA